MSICRGEAPLHGSLGCIAGFFPHLHLPAHPLYIQQTPIQVLASQNGKFDLHRVQPTGMVGRVVTCNFRVSRRASSGGKVWYSAAGVWVFRLSRTKRMTSASGYTSSTRCFISRAKSWAVRCSVTTTSRQPRAGQRPETGYTCLAAGTGHPPAGVSPAGQARARAPGPKVGLAVHRSTPLAALGHMAPHTGPESPPSAR